MDDVGAGLGEGQMDQTWFDMENIRRRKLDKAVWIPLRAYQEDKVGSTDSLDTRSKSFAAGSVVVSVLVDFCHDSRVIPGKPSNPESKVRICSMPCCSMTAK